MPLPLLDDEPTLDDQLQRLDRVLQMRDMVAQCRTPQVFGVHGDWGAGKTSFLHQLQWELVGECPQQPEKVRATRADAQEPQENVTVVWFEAWRHQNEPTPIVALLHEIRSQLPWTARYRDHAQKLGEVTVRASLLAIENITKTIGIQASKIQQEGEKWEKEHLTTPLPAHFVREHLEREVSRLVKRTSHDEDRLVVIIDDLDRCQPAAAYALLEGIKIYLNLPSTVFVLGMNQKVVEKAIADQLPDTRKDERWIEIKSREYLEKICQNVVHLPLVDKPSVLLSRFLEDFPEGTALVLVVNEYDCLPRNPRQVKTFANLLLRCSDRFPQLADPQRQAQLIVAFAALYQFHPELYRQLTAYRKPFYDELRDWCRGVLQDAKHPFSQQLERSWRVRKSDPKATTPEESLLDVQAFPDPVEGGVLRVQRLIAELDATKDEINDFLLF
jgi:hypothetical protein